MISARHWRERRAFWQTFVFWAWLASFIFGFAASDVFHGPNCPEQLALRAAHNHDVAQDATFSQLSVLHAASGDAICPTCLLQLGALGVLVLALALSVPFVGAAIFARPRPSHSIAHALIYGARGPPVSFI